MNLDELRLFVALAEAPSLAAAGRTVGLGPGGASAALKRLEQRTRVRLVERSTRSFRLTPEGERFLGTCEAVLEVWSRGEEALREGREGLAGNLTVAAPQDLAEQYLEPWLGDFVRQHPKVRISLLPGDAHHRIPADGVDVAVRYGHTEDSGAVARRLLSGERVVVAAPAYLEAHGMPETPDDLVTHRAVTWLRRERPYTRWTLRAGDQSRTVDVDPVLCGDGASARRWCVAGFGLAFKSRLDVAADLRAGRLVRVLPGWSGEDVPLYALTPSRRFRTARVQALLDHLQHELRGVVGPPSA